MKSRLAIAIFLSFTMLTAACSRKQEAVVIKPHTGNGARVEKISLAPVEELYEAAGTVRAKTVSVLSSKIVGSVVRMRVREGDRVRAGQVVVEIDGREPAAQLARAQAGQREAQGGAAEVERNISAAEASKVAAEASLALAAATFERYKALFERHSVSRQEFDEAQARHKVAAAEVERAAKLLESYRARRNQMLARIDQSKADLDSAQLYAAYAQITSPINGVVTAKQADIGFMAAPGTPLVTVEDDSAYRLEVAIGESRLASIRLNDQVRVTIEALGADEIAGRVAELVPAADPASRSTTIKIDLADASRRDRQHLLRSGLYGTAKFITGQKPALTVPQQAIIERGQLSGVFVVDADDVARWRLIKTGKPFGDRVEVLSGLSDGERIVVDRVEAVSDGSKLEP